MFEDLLGDFELDERSLYALGLAIFAGIFAFWNMNRIETLSSMWALASGILTVIVSFIVITFLWNR